MFSTITFIASAALLATAAPFPRSHSLEQRDPAEPANWWSGLEDYNTYHGRYMALDCEDQHSTAFFTACCHPLLKTESLEKDRPAFCNPANDCDDDNEPEHEAPKPAPAAKPTPAAPKPPVNVEPSPKPAAPKPPVNVAPAPAAPKPAPAAPKPAPAPAPAPAPKPAPAPAPSSDVHTGGFGTWFTQNGNAGACGTVHSDNDLIVALDSALYDNGSHCGQSVTITDTATKKQVTAKVADECPTCDNANCLDMSTGLFQQFADLPVGQIDITWVFN